MALKKTDDAFMDSSKEDGPDVTATKITEVEAVKGQFAVRLDPQHPAGQYQRAGVQFVSGKDVFFDVVPESIQVDPWLMVAKIEGEAPPVYNTPERRKKQAGRLL